MKYQIQATAAEYYGETVRSTQIPTFYIEATSADEAITKTLLICDPFRRKSISLTVYCADSDDYRSYTRDIRDLTLTTR